MRDAIRALFKETKAQALVCSAACGADLLALEVADDLGLYTKVVLPFSPEPFRSTSVTDRPGDWGPLFDRLVSTALQQRALDVIEHSASDHEAYLHVTGTLLQIALDLAKRTREGATAAVPGVVTAVVVWDGAPRGVDDLTAHFAASAQALAIPMHSIHT